jgi:cellulose synthase (UDP-forming)
MIETAPQRGLRPRDRRLRPAAWRAEPKPGLRRRIAVMVVIDVALAVFYFSWLLSPARVGILPLFALLILAEIFNLVQASGFWWTVLGQRRYRSRPWQGPPPAVDVLIPVYGEPVEIVEPTVAAARRMHGAQVSVHLLDDGGDDEMRRLAARHRINYITRERHTGAKAGNINHALARTDAPYVVVLDCDHVPEPHFLTATMGHLQDEQVAFAQTPQYYANAADGGVAAAAWAQQALFFGPIARGKDGFGAMFCAGTNVVFSRTALEQVGGFPEDSLTEDFELSIRLHELGWRSRYVPEVLAKGLGPEDMSSYVSQQQRWARGCLGGISSALRARLPLRLRLQYLLASMYFLSGWTVLLYMSFPVIRILTGAQPLAGATADQFLLHFSPYFCASLATVAVAGAGAYTWRAFTLAAASFWIHVRATALGLVRRRGRFVVTPKHGAEAPQPTSVWPTLAMLALLIGVAAYGLARRRDPATLNNVSFAALHITVLTTGVWPALAGSAGAAMLRSRQARRRLVARQSLAAGVVTGVVAVAVVAGILLGEGAAPSPRPAARPVTADPATLAREAGLRFLSRYERPDGQVVRLDQGGDTVSEGQAYAMLVSVAIGDPARFDAAWSWTRTHLLKRSGLLASRWAGRRVADPQPASDADLDAARALGLAAVRFHDPADARAARAIARAILAHETFRTSGGRLLAAGPWAVRQRVVNPSYSSPAGFTDLQRLDPADARRWAGLAAASTRAIGALERGGDLPPDWTRATAQGTLIPIATPGHASIPPEYSLDAERVPIRFAVSCSAAQRTISGAIWPTLYRAGSQTPYTLTLQGQPLTTDSHPVALVGAAAAAWSDGDRADALRLLNQATSLDSRYPTYYGGAWNALGRIMLTTDWLAPACPAP